MNAYTVDLLNRENKYILHFIYAECNDNIKNLIAKAVHEKYSKLIYHRPHISQSCNKLVHSAMLDYQNSNKSNDGKLIILDECTIDYIYKLFGKNVKFEANGLYYTIL